MQAGIADLTTEIGQRLDTSQSLAAVDAVDIGREADIKTDYRKRRS